MGSVAGKLTRVVGAVTLGFGVALTVAPLPSARALGLDVGAVPVRAIGLADLVIAGGLLRAGPRWPWMASRAALNAVLVAAYAAEARRSGRRAGARAGVAAMSVLTVVDAGLTVALAKRRDPHPAESRLPS
ncbi:hypothetical protein D7147_16425 [Micromonospora musae]|uniref:DUF4267 domain-containing protein n=1 Tax=Micromonospora musae TaxID=1894970 RepID=A0ABX9R6R6_9ACTN|nr:hypothetical protein [Micromonospora musae]RKN18985.1 hypothetical protein D7147_16425 [Micromonospora musae]